MVVETHGFTDHGLRTGPGKLFVGVLDFLFYQVDIIKLSLDVCYYVRPQLTI